MTIVSTGTARSQGFARGGCDKIYPANEKKRLDVDMVKRSVKRNLFHVKMCVWLNG